MFKFVKMALATLALSGIAAAAHAGTYTDNSVYYLQDANPTGSYYVAGQTVSMSIRANNNGASGSYSNVTAGTFGLQSSTNQSGPWTSLLTYCLDVDQGLSLKNAGTNSGNTQYLASTVSEKIGTGSDDSFGKTAIASAVQTTVQKLWGGVFTYSAFTSASIDVSSAALQIVLWEIFDEAKNGSTTYSLTSGYFRAQGGTSTQNSVITLANNILSNMSSWVADTTVLVLTNGSAYCNPYANQDFIVSNPPGTKTPEPAALGLVLLGLAAMLRSRRDLRARI